MLRNLFRRIRDTNPVETKPDNLFERANFVFCNGDLDETISLCKRILTESPCSSYYWECLFVAHFLKGEHDIALSTLDCAIEACGVTTNEKFAVYR